MNLTHNTDRVLQNPRWRQDFSIYRTTRVPGEYGRAIIEENVIPAVGVIQPASGDDLDRLNEGDRVNGAITVHTKTALSPGDDGILPDEIEWRGVRYLVCSVRDWHDYGIGWCKAICTAQAMKGLSS